MIGVRLKIPASMLDTFRRGEPVVIDDVRGPGDLARSYRQAVGPFIDAPAMRYVRSFPGVPLVHRDRLIGLLTLSSRSPNAYLPADARFSMAIAAYAAAAIENARLYEETRAAEVGLARQVDRLAALTEITHRLLAATELGDLLDVLLESAMRLSRTTGAAVGLLEDGGRVIRFAATAGESEDYRERFGPAVVDEDFLENTAVGQALATRSAIAVEDYTRWGDPARWHALHAAALGLQVRAQIVAPLILDGAPIGVLRVHDGEPRTFGPEDIRPPRRRWWRCAPCSSSCTAPRWPSRDWPRRSSAWPPPFASAATSR
jgi:GAF domain-containing protein